MIENEQKIELLSPAKNKECAIAAINAGADAVYIGPESFGARKKAGNSLLDIKEIIDYAHKFNVKIYVTVNTLIFDNELKSVEKLIWDLYEIGVDAIIFQDFAILEMNLPPIALHASTQCNNDALEKIKFLKNCNVQRVVLPREFSVDEIKNITNNCDIETEIFVHGALCVSYSGQCYFSNHIGARSANRGDCAQPCRKKFSLIDEKGKIILKPQYLLSMKDFSLAKHLKELLEAGVTSLKIEGRLKDSDYVKNVVSFYRKKIDEIDAALKPSSGDVLNDFKPDLNKTFNRGYTDFYFDGKRKDFINPLTPKFIGEKIGTVTEINKNKIKIDSKTELLAGDRIAFETVKNEITGTTVVLCDKGFYELRDCSDIKVATVIYRNYDSEFNKKLQNVEFKRKLPIKIFVNNEKIVLNSFNDNEVAYKLEEMYEIAQNTVKAKENIAKQLSKLGDTEFYASIVDVSEDFNLFIPVSKINEIRRDAVSLLLRKSEQNYAFQRRDTAITLTDYPFKELDYSSNISNQKAKAFYEKCGSHVKKFAPECVKCKSGITLMKTKHCLRDFAGICLKNCKPNGDLYLLDDYGQKYKLDFDCQKCIMKIEEPV